MTRKRYANTLEAIGELGAVAFYKGDIASATLNAIQASNGIMTLEDLEKYAVIMREPVRIQYRRYNLASCSAPASGTVVLSVMNTIRGYNMGTFMDIGLTTPRLDEAIRFAFGQVCDTNQFFDS